MAGVVCARACVRQSASDEKDAENCRKLNDYMNNPQLQEQEGGAAPSQPQDVQDLLSSMLGWVSRQPGRAAAQRKRGGRERRWGAERVGVCWFWGGVCLWWACSGDCSGAPGGGATAAAPAAPSTTGEPAGHS